MLLMSPFIRLLAARQILFQQLVFDTLVPTDSCSHFPPFSLSTSLQFLFKRQSCLLIKEKPCRRIRRDATAITQPISVAPRSSFLRDPSSRTRPTTTGVIPLKNHAVTTPPPNLQSYEKRNPDITRTMRNPREVDPFVPSWDGICL